MRTPIEQLQAMKSFLKQTGGNLGKPAEQIRSEMAQAAKQLPALPGDVQVKKVTIQQFAGEWVIAPCINAEGRTRAILYFHGEGLSRGTVGSIVIWQPDYLQPAVFQYLQWNIGLPRSIVIRPQMKIASMHTAGCWRRDIRRMTLSLAAIR